MGIGRCIKIRELKHDLNAIKQLSPDGRKVLKGAFQKTMVQLWCEYRIPVSEILSAESFHVVEDAHWAQAAFTISSKYRILLRERAQAGDDAAKDMLLATGVILHSIRAILDFELNSRNDLMLYCQTLWYELADGDFEQIPPRFKKK
jgi:hypothetical protein